MSLGPEQCEETSQASLLSPIEILKSLGTSPELEHLKALHDKCTSPELEYLKVLRDECTSPELEYIKALCDECLKALLNDDGISIYQETSDFSELSDESDFSTEVDYFLSGVDYVFSFCEDLESVERRSKNENVKTQ